MLQCPALLFCKLRAFRKSREGEVLQVQQTCPCLLKPSLTSGPGDSASCHHLPLSAWRDEAESLTLAGLVLVRATPALKFARAQLSSGRKEKPEGTTTESWDTLEW